MTRRARVRLGALLLTIGLAGVLSVSALSASAEERSNEDSHAVMHEMIDAVHGPGTSARVHRVEGAEQMMERCPEMMTMMERMRDEGMMDMMMPEDMGGMMDQRMPEDMGGIMDMMQR